MRPAAHLTRPLLRLRAHWLRWQLDCLVDERERYQAIGAVGPVYLLHCRQQERALMARLREVHEAITAKPAPRPRMGLLRGWERWLLRHATLVTLALALISVAGLLAVFAGTPAP